MINKIKKILIFLIICVITSTFNNKVTAEGYNATEKTESSSKPAGGSGCDPGDTCMWWFTSFELRISIVDKNLKQVPLTRTVHFSPYQPSDEYGYEGEGTYYNYNDVTTPINKDYSWKRVNGDYDEDYYFIGSYITGSQWWWEGYDDNIKNHYFPNRQYYTYMGFGDTKVEGTDFGNYSNLHNKFINYATDISSKKNRVEIDGEQKYVNFIDFFLKVSNFSDTWESSKSYEIVKKIADGDYYLIIEPVYHMGTDYNGHSHNIHGTSKQLALFLQGQIHGYFCEHMGANCDWWYPNDFAIVNERDVLYNVFCNFMDNNSTLFDVRGNPRQECNDVFSRVYDRQIDDYNALATDVFARLYARNSPFGVSSIDLSALFKHKIKDLTRICKFETSTCNNNDFKIESNLYLINDDKTLDAGKNKVFGCLDNLGDDKDKYFFTVTDSQDHKLWCYDNISYDFSKLKDLENKEYAANTLMEIPSGALNVDRTCYSNGDIQSDILDNVLKYDNITNRNNIYQNEFKFNLFGKDYTFKRNDTIQTDGTISKTNVTDNMGPIQDKYIYTSNFSYNYDLYEGHDNTNLRIGINDFNLTNGISNTNSIDFFANFERGKTIVTSKSTETKFTNTLDAQIDNKYGLSTKPINTIESTIVNVNSVRENKKITTSVTTNMITILQVSNDEDNQCELNTELKNNDVLNSGAQFRVISLSNPFPARDGTSRIPGGNWLNETENNVYEYIQNNRNVNAEQVYQQEPLYTVTLDTTSMIKIREYNKSHTYSDSDITCAEGIGRKCLSNFLRNNEYIKNLEGTCASVDLENISGFYTCADKTEKSGGKYNTTKCEKYVDGRCANTAKSGV